MVAYGAAALAGAWTLAVWATLQELGRRWRGGLLAVETTPPSYPPLVCACPLDGGDAADGFASLPPAGGAPVTGVLTYPGRLSCVFLADATDASASARAKGHVARVRALGRNAAAVATTPDGRNRKAAQLAQLPDPLRGAPSWSAGPPAPDTIVLALDSDVEPDSVRAAELVAYLHAHPNVAAVWQPCAPAERGLTWGDWVSSAILGAGAHAMPLLAVLDGCSPVGKVLAYRPRALAETGGWQAATDELGDDVGVGARLRAAGYTVAALPGRAGRAPRHGQRARDVARRLLRWLAVVAEQRPALRWSYPAYLAHLPLLLALWAACAAGGVPRWACGAGAALAFASRLQLGALARRSCGQAPGGWRLVTDVLGGDVVLLALYCYAGTRPVAWWNGRRVPRSRSETP